MNDPTLSPDDPKLTAYALGELDADESIAVEALLRHDPAARAAVEEIRTAAAQLEGALAAEAEADTGSVERTALARAAIVTGNDYRKLDGGPLWKITRFPQIYYVIGGLAAACFAVMVAWRGPAPKHERKRYVEVALPAAEPVAATESVAAAGVASPVEVKGIPDQPAVRMFDARAVGLLQLSEKFADAAKSPNPSIALQPHPPGAMTYSGATGTVAGTAAGAVPGRLNRERARAQNDVAIENAAFRNAGGRTYVYPPDNGFVIQAEPSDAASPSRSPAASQPSLPAGRGLVATNGPGATPLARSSTSSLALNDNLSFGEQRRTFVNPAAAPAGPVPFSGLDLYARRPPPQQPPQRETAGTESYAYVRDNDFLATAQNPFSTFAADVDTASYSNVRRFIEGGRLPPADAVRIEELVNYFPYHYEAPGGGRRADGDASAAHAAGVPFAAALEVAEAPWAPTHRLVRIGLKAREPGPGPRSAANLVFLLDVSGSMDAPNKLPLVKESLRLLVGKLQPTDRVAIVTYAGSSGLALPSTPVTKAREILAALDALTPGGSTNGAMGIQLAYDIAKANFVTGGVNRIVLCTDGDFNVGPSSEGELTRLIEEKTKSGVFLTVLGFGMGNIKDSTLELLADKGNGHYGYIDTRREAEKVLVEQVNGTLVTIAKDVKIQVDFNPAKVAAYRLIGYENRLLKAEDFNNDRVDAGEVGAGHTVTALYEIVPVGAPDAGRTPPVDASKYTAAPGSRLPAPGSQLQSSASNELLTVKLRYKEPAADESRKVEFPLGDAERRFTEASADFRFAAAVAGFGMILRDSPHKGTATIGDVVAWAAAASAHPADDPGGYRSDFIGLARQAQALLR